MTSDDRLTNLMFLFALAPLATACDDPGETTTSTTTPGTTTGPSTTSGPDQTTGPGDTTTTGPDATTVAETTAGPMTSSTTEPTTGEPINCEPEDKLPKVGEIDPACTAYNELSNECYFDGGLPAECLELYDIYCQYYLDQTMAEYGEECAAAAANYLGCFGALTCEDVKSGGEFCAKELAALEMACGMLQNPLRPSKIMRRR